MIIQMTVLLSAVAVGTAFVHTNGDGGLYIKSDHAPGGLVTCTNLGSGHALELDPNAVQVTPQPGAKVISG